MANEYKRARRGGQRRDRLVEGQHVLPHWVARAPVGEHGLVGLVGCRQADEKGLGLLAQNRARPARRFGSLLREYVEVDSAEHSQIVIPDEADGSPCGDESTAFIRPRPVADEVSKTPERLGVARVDRAERRLESLEVPVNIGDDGDSHRRRVRLAVFGCRAGFRMGGSRLLALKNPGA